MNDENWMNENIIIDFKVPDDIKFYMDLCESANKENDYSYFNYLDALDCVCKEAVVVGDLTDKEWDTIMERYSAYE